MKKCLFLLLPLLAWISCNEKNNNSSFITAIIDEDNSEIADPRARWESYKLSDYSIDQTWACECYPPAGCTSYIVNDAVTEVNYQLSKDSYYGRTENEIHNYTKNKSITIDEAFDIIDKYKTNAYRVKVEYDPKFGFPTKLFIDIDSLMIDEEIIRSFSNLRKIVN